MDFDVAIVTKMLSTPSLPVRRAITSAKTAHWLSVVSGLAVGVLLLAPPPSGPPAWIAEQMPSFLLGNLDKAVHVGLFFALAGIWLRSFERLPGWRRPVAMAVGLAVGYGVLLELLQGLTPDRAPSLADALADLLGAGLLWLLARRFHKPEST